MLLDRRDKRELLELRERLRRQAADDAQTVYPGEWEPAPCPSPEEWNASLPERLANVRGSTNRH